jgi:hypothetical protein
MSQESEIVDLIQNTKKRVIKKYGEKICSPANIADIESFEKRNNITLPLDYKLFISQVYNGGPGPFYGLKPLELDGTYENLKYACSWTEDTSAEEYNKIRSIDDATEDDFDNIFNGLLEIATEGCTYMIYLAVTGKSKGRIVYCESSFEFNPFFTQSKSFIEWWLGWFNEMEKGYSTSSYGYRLLGDSNELIDKYKNSNMVNEKFHIASSMYKFPGLTDSELSFVYECYLNENDENLKTELLKLLVNFNSPYTKSIIHAGLNSDKRNEFVEIIIQYQKDKYEQWYHDILNVLPELNERTTDRAYYMLLAHCRNAKVEDILAFFNHKDVRMRQHALMNLFRFCKTENYIDKILPMFQDEKPVIMQAVYMTHDSNDKRLIPIYKNIVRKYYSEMKPEDNTMFIYIKQFLEKFNIDINSVQDQINSTETNGLDLFENFSNSIKKLLGLNKEKGS